MTAAERAASRAAATTEWMRPIHETAGSQEVRDKFLPGAAGVAVVAALGIACQRRLSEPADADRYGCRWESRHGSDTNKSIGARPLWAAGIHNGHDPPLGPAPVRA
jgi:hypothetical protein